MHCTSSGSSGPTMEQLRVEGGIMEKEYQITRRSALKAAAAGGSGPLAIPQELQATIFDKPKGNLNQSVCKWCYKDMALEDLARESARIGIKSVELLTPEEWPVVKKYGLTCAMGSGADQI